MLRLVGRHLVKIEMKSVSVFKRRLVAYVVFDLQMPSIAGGVVEWRIVAHVGQSRVAVIVLCLTEIPYVTVRLRFVSLSPTPAAAQTMLRPTPTVVQKTPKPRA